MLRAAILHECQNYLGGGGGLGGSEKNRAIIPDAHPSVHLTVRRGIFKRSHEKTGDCEQSTGHTATAKIFTIVSRRSEHDGGR